jgi:hypothetical protein
MRGRPGVRWAIALAVSIAMLLPGVGSASPGAARRGEVHCRAQATKLGDEITVTFWLSGAHPHRRSRIRIWQNDELLASRTRVTNARGSIRVQAGAENLPHTDVFRFRAVNEPSGSSCAVVDLRD